MNKGVLILTFWLVIVSIKAQVVFCPLGAEWKNVYIIIPGQSAEIETILFTGITVVGTDTIKELTHQRFFISSSDKKNESTFIKQKGDTIFLKNSRTNNTWQILYNFAAMVGNSWNNSMVDVNGVINYTTIVNSIQNVVINGFTLKRLTVTQDNNIWPSNNFTINITERLGSNWSLFPFVNGHTFAGAADGGNFDKNLCYSDSSLYWGPQGFCLPQLTGMKELKNNDGKFKIYPTLVSDILHIESELEMYKEGIELSFTDLLGREIKRVPVVDDKINVGDLPEGIYLLDLKKDNKIIYNAKIVKQD